MPTNQDLSKVTCEGRPSITTQNPTPNPVARSNAKSSSSEVVTAPPQKTIEKPQEQKPTLPPKPQWTKSVIVEEADVPVIIKDNLARAVIPPNAKQFTAGNQKNTIHNKIPQETSDKPCHQRFPDEAQQAKECLPKHSKNTTPLTGTKSDCRAMVSHSTEMEMERNVIQKINAAEAIQVCLKQRAEDARCDMNVSLKAALQNFERKDSEVLDKRLPLSKKVKVINDKVGENKPTHQCNSNSSINQKSSAINACHMKQNDGQQKHEDKVVLREKKVKETEDERRQRLSVHKDEIMKGNVNAAMEIFENLKKRDELKGILTHVQAIEGESSNVNVGSLKTLYRNVPAWVAAPSGNAKQSKKEEKKVDVETQDDDLESVSSVETAFEDLEKASKEIMHLKEQTLEKLLEIEETIKKALYSVSNLKSETDIAGLSGLFDESLKSEQHVQSANNIRKISIGSSKAKSGDIKETVSDSGPSRQEASQPVHKPLIRQSSQSSPSFISIHSAARKPAEQPKPAMTTFKPQLEGNSQADAAQRKVSVLEVKTVPEQPAGIFGTKTVSETYEESDAFGNVFVSSVTSTFVTKQSESKSSPLFEVVGSPTRYEVTASPSLRRAARPFEDVKETGKVFVTFSQPTERQ